MRAVLIAPNGVEWRIDTPDPELIGVWLKSIFSTLSPPSRGLPAPIEFRLEMSP
jgi:hypothetical protein